MKDFYRIAGISRAPIYSPNSIDKDGAIFLAVLQHLEAKGHQVKVYQEDDLLHDIITKLDYYTDVLNLMKKKKY